MPKPLSQTPRGMFIIALADWQRAWTTHADHDRHARTDQQRGQDHGGVHQRFIDGTERAGGGQLQDQRGERPDPQGHHHGQGAG